MKTKIFTKKMTLATKKNLKLVRQLDRQLKKLNISTQKLKYISADLADIYVACVEYIEIIKRIIAKKNITKNSFANDMITIEIILYHHLYWHMKELKNPINNLFKIFYGKKRQNIITEIFKFR